MTLGTVTFASLGLIVASVTNTMQETQIINQIIWFVFLFISGATIPFPMLPRWFRSRGLPAGHVSGQWAAARHDRPHQPATSLGHLPGFARRLRADRVHRVARNSSAGSRKPKSLAGPSSGSLPRWFRFCCWAYGKTSTATCAATPRRICNRSASRIRSSGSSTSGLVTIFPRHEHLSLNQRH